MPEPIIVYTVKEEELPGGGIQFIGLETWNPRAAPVIVKRKIIGGKYKKKEAMTIEDIVLICDQIEEIKKARDDFMAPAQSGSTERLELMEKMK
jgi:hypothetical protein